jgi:hypothetical protein
MTDQIQQVQTLSESKEGERRKQMEILGNILKEESKPSSQIWAKKNRPKVTYVKTSYNNCFDVDYYHLLDSLDPLIRDLLKANQESEELDDITLLDSFRANKELQHKLIESMLKKKISRSTKRFLKDIKIQISYELTDKQLRSLLVSYNNTLTRRER